MQLPGTTIYEALKPRFDGDTARIDVKKITLAHSSEYNNLVLLRGDINFSRAEQHFSVAIAQAITEAVHEKNTYAVLTRMFRDLSKLHSFDYVLCDVGPSAGSITRMVILACDGVFIPTTPDRFSFQAVQGMGSIISDWLTRHEAVVASFEPFGLEAYFPKTSFYGAILNNYKIHRAGKKKASYLKWEERVREALCSMLQDQAQKRLEPVRPVLLSHPFVASIRDVGPMAPVAPGQSHRPSITAPKIPFTFMQLQTPCSLGRILCSFLPFWASHEDRYGHAAHAGVCFDFRSAQQAAYAARSGGALERHGVRGAQRR